MRIQCPHCTTGLKINSHCTVKDTARVRCGRCKHIFRIRIKRFYQTQCQHCQTQLKIPTSKVKKSTVRIRCYQCQHIFTYHPFAVDDPGEYLKKLYYIHKKQYRRVLIIYQGSVHTEMVTYIQKSLKNHGHDIKYEFNTSDISLLMEKGFSWISEDLDHSCMLLMMSHETIGRPDGTCLNVLHHAMDRGIPVLSIRLDHCMPPVLISDHPFIDLSHLFPIEDYQNDLSQTINALALILEQDEPDINSMFENQQSRFIRLFRPLPYEGMIPGYLMRFSGRSDLLQLLDQWVADPDSEKIMILTGLAGTGKTAIAAWYAAFSPQAAGFHICRYGDRHMSDPRRWVLSSAYQLSLFIPSYDQYLCGIDLETIVSYYDNRTLFDLLLVQPFERIPCDQLPTAVLVMDGLDQATRMGDNTLSQLIASEWIRTPSFLKLLITSRNEPEVLEPLKCHHPGIINISNKQYDTDARNYISRYMKPYIPEHLSIEDCTDIIFQRSEGIFLYIEWLRRELAQGRLGPDDITRLPEGLNGMYTWLFNTQFHDHEAYKKKILPLLNAMAAAQEPLSLEMIAHLIDWELHDRQTLHDILGMLFSVTGNCFHFFHRSLGDWLRNPSLSKAYTIDEHDGHCELARLGMNACKEGGECLPDYMLAHLPFHLCQAQQWDNLDYLLTDLFFIEKKCSSGMTYDLIRDFEDAICALPECQSLMEHQKEHARQLSQYTRSIIAYARGECDFPETFSSAHPVSEEQIAAENKRIACSPTRKDRILSFYQFIFAQRHDFAKFSSVPGFCFQQAYNSSNTGPIAIAAKSMIDRGVNHIFLEQIISHSLLQSFQPALLRTLSGHSSWVICVAITPDGRRVVSGSVDETLRVWDPEIGECLRVLKGHKNIVHDVSITPDGLLVLSGSQDKCLRLWNTLTGNCENVFEKHQDGIISTAITPDGTVGASADQSGQIHIWNLKNGTCTHSLNTSTTIHCIEISLDGKRLFISFGNQNLHIWNITTDQQLNKIDHIYVNSCFAITPDERLVISDTNDSNAIIWDMSNPANKITLAAHEKAIESVGITPDGCHAITASKDKSIRIWDTQSGVCYRHLQGHTRRIISVCIRSDARKAISAGLDKTLRVWDIENGKCIQHLDTHTFSVNSICISQDGKTAISGSLDKLICLWDLETGACKNILEGHSGSVESVNLSSTGEWAVTGSRDKTVRLWNIQTGECFLHLQGHTDDVYSVCISTDGKRAVSGSRDKTLRIWDLESGNCLKTLKGHSLTVGSVRITPDKRKAVSGSRDKTLRIWDIDSGKCLKTLKGHTMMVESVIVSACGKRLISASRDRTVRIWDMKSGKCIHILLGHTGWIRTITTTPDGKYVISGSWDCTLRVWDMQTGQCLAVFQTENDVSALSEVTQNGRFACGTKAGRVILLKFHNKMMN